MILLSAHNDTVYNSPPLAFHNGVHSGLLDNHIGVLLAYLTLYDDPNIIHLEKASQIALFHSKCEEWGLSYDFPKLNQKKDIIIVVDVCSGEQYNKYDFSIENISRFTEKEIKELKEHFRWEGFNPLVKKITWNPDEEDEAFIWAEKGFKVMSFIIPIQSVNDGWHRIQSDCSIGSDKIILCRQGLKRLINYLV
jgi:hypothetical protein